MKPTSLTQLIGSLLIIASLISCNQNASSSYELKGTLAGITTGKAIIAGINSEEPFSDTANITEGQFIFKGKLPEPGQYYLTVEDKEYPVYFYAENAKMTLTGHADTLYNAEVKGGKINEDDAKYTQGIQDLFKKHKLDSLYTVYEKTRNEADMRIIDSVSAIVDTESYQFELEFIRQNPKSYYSAILVERRSSGLSAGEIEKYVAMLDPSLEESAIVGRIREEIETLKHTDVKLEAFINDAPDMEFQLDSTFAGSTLKGFVYLATFSNGQICGLKRDSTVWVIDPAGKKVREFKANLKGQPSALAIAPTTGTLYVLSTLSEMKEATVRGKVVKVTEYTGVECLVYDSKGNEIRTFTLPEVKKATGAKIINNKLLVADVKQRQVAIFNLESGKLEATIKNMRACCGILDFGVNDKDEILVANLGAFRVQAFDYSGTIKYAFGKRGQGLDDFHGCCNPVNVTYLTNGAVVTVEKDPTRIKVYTRSGARKIEGIQELVKGCTYIPMTTDSNNNLYLASANSGIVKCIPVPIQQ
ncbi:MAG: DUF4369 domain-containing protein [Bacteroidota bacterium]